MPEDNFFLNNLELIFLVFFGVGALIGSFVQAQKRKYRSISLENAPVLMTYYTDGADHMLPLTKGKIGELRYSAISILGNYDGMSKSSALFYMVELPFTTELHLVGIPKRSNATQLNPSLGKSIMEKVVLEGDYNNYFTLYCEKGMQMQARYILDPKAMAFTVDFCQSHNWEIIGHELHFIQGQGTHSKDDPTHMFDDVEQFVKEFRPMIAKPASEDAYAKLHATLKPAYSDYKCPVCSSPLEEHSGHFNCPKNHGILLKGYKLPMVRKGQIKNPRYFEVGHDRPSKIKCPVCGSHMEHVNYAGSSTIIDSCSGCPFRWLDAGELAPKQRHTIM